MKEKELREGEVMAICKRTYPDEDDMQDCCDGRIEPYEVKIYYKGEKYPVMSVFVNTEYFEIP